MGLDPEAARAVDVLMNGGDRALGSLTVFSAIWIVVGAIGMASTLQTWYLRIYDQPRSKGILKRLAYQAAGVVAYPLYIWFQLWVFDVARPAGGRLLIFLVTLVITVLFWWCSAYFLLLRNVPWRRLLPAGLATGAFLTGLGVFSWLFFSAEVVSGQNNYGPAGVALALISYLVGYGVCLHLGAVFGRIWLDWRSAGATADQPAFSDDVAPAEPARH
jgi:membrane protein